MFQNGALGFHRGSNLLFYTRARYWFWSNWAVGPYALFGLRALPLAGTVFNSGNLRLVKKKAAGIGIRMAQPRCAIKHEGNPPTCPMNGQVCKPVGRITLERLLKANAKGAMTIQPYYFCDAADCDTVYVSATADHVIPKDQLTVRVGIKETEDPIPVCYCFGFDRKALWDDIRSKGTTGIPKNITERVRAGECRCEVTNPSGTCCLGDVYRAVQRGQAMGEQGLL